MPLVLLAGRLLSLWPGLRILRLLTSWLFRLLAPRLGTKRRHTTRGHLRPKFVDLGFILFSQPLDLGAVASACVSGALTRPTQSLSQLLLVLL